MQTDQQPLNGTVLLSDGSLEFRVRGQTTGEVSTVTIDLLILKLCCEECEDRHQLPVINGQMKPTPEFLADLASRLKSNGVKDCTPALAWQLWVAGINQMEALKKNMSETPNLPSGSESIPAHSPPPSGLDGALTSDV